MREDEADNQSNVDQLIVGTSNRIDAMIIGTSEQGGSIGRTGLNKSGAIRCHSHHSSRQPAVIQATGR